MYAPSNTEDTKHKNHTTQKFYIAIDECVNCIPGQLYVMSEAGQGSLRGSE